MRIVWSAQRAYRCFYSPAIHKADIVSSHLVRNAKGQMVSGVLLLVVDELGEFCDLEIMLAEKDRMARPIMPQGAVRVEGKVDTHIDDLGEVGWFFDESVNTLVVSLFSGSPTRWLEVYKDYLYLEIDLQGQIKTIIFQNVQIDPEGELQSSWLESLEGSLDRT